MSSSRMSVVKSAVAVVMMLACVCAFAAEGDAAAAETTEKTPIVTDGNVAAAEKSANVVGGDAAAAEKAEKAEKAVKTAVDPAIFYAIAVIMSVGSIAASLAVGKIGAAAMGAAAEKPELLGKAIAFVGLGEGIALFGVLISLFLVFKI